MKHTKMKQSEYTCIIYGVTIYEYGRSLQNTCTYYLHISRKTSTFEKRVSLLWNYCENSVLFGFLYSPEVQVRAVHLIISMVSQSLGVEEDMLIIYNKRTFCFSLWLSKFSHVEWQPFWITFLIKRVYKIFFGYVLLYQNDVNTAKKEKKWELPSTRCISPDHDRMNTIQHLITLR